MLCVKLGGTLCNSCEYIKRSAKTCGKGNACELFSVVINPFFLLGSAKAYKKDFCTAGIDVSDYIVCLLGVKETVSSDSRKAGILLLQFFDCNFINGVSLLICLTAAEEINLLAVISRILYYLFRKLNTGNSFL